MTQHTKAYCTLIDQDVSPNGVALKVYTHSPEGRFLAVGWLYMQAVQLTNLLDAIDRERDLSEQPMLPPWDAKGEENVRWLPPRP